MPDYTNPERDRIALLTFAVQKDCAEPGSPVGYLGGGRKLARIGELAQGFRAAGAPIVHLVRLYRPDGSNVDACRRRAIEEGLRVLMPGSCGVELVPEINPAPETRLDSAESAVGQSAGARRAGVGALPAALGRLLPDQPGRSPEEPGRLHHRPLRQQLLDGDPRDHL